MNVQNDPQAGKVSIILAAGPSRKRDEAFAAKLADLLSDQLQLPEAQAVSISCSDFLERDDKGMQTYQNDLPFAGDGKRYVVVHGDNLLAQESLRKVALLRIYVDADELEVASDALQALRMEDQPKEARSPAGQGSRKTGRKAERRSPTLSEEVNKILTERKELIESEVASTMQYADIVVAFDESIDEACAGIVNHVVRTDPSFSNRRLDEAQRRQRIEQMTRQFETAKGRSMKAKLKKKLWMLVVDATLFFKRLMDIVISLVALLLLSPLFAFVALCIKLTDGGPVFYVQTRIGKQGKAFPFPKFRSMVMNADKLKDSLLGEAERKGDVTFKMKRDPRVTRIGRFIRRFSIDELPQLWCVLKGDMSIVGPRPPVPREVALYTQEDRRRLEVTPGLTGIWQVSGRADIGFKQQVELDVLYIESHGFWLDLKLILKTIPAVLTGKGAY